MNPLILAIAVAVRAEGGRALLVGGCVRDKLLGIEPKDYDMEVFGIEEAKLVALMDELGPPLHTLGLKVDAPHEAEAIRGVMLWVDGRTTPIRVKLETDHPLGHIDVRCIMVNEVVAWEATA